MPICLDFAPVFLYSLDMELGETMLVEVATTCRQCEKVVWVEAPEEEWEAYLSGTVAQLAFTNLTPDERELLISHICGTCFDKLFLGVVA